MNTNKLLLAVLLGTALGQAHATDLIEDEPRVEEHRVMRVGPMAAGEEMPMMGGAMMRMHRKAVKGMPYSAEVINERIQNLADGNQIASKSSTMSYRDGAGRTRQDINDAKGELRTVMIHDPVAGSVITLNPKDKSASKMMLKELGAQAGEKARERIEQMRKEGRLPGGDGKQHEEIIVKRGEGKPGEEIVIKRVERLDGEQRMRIREDVRVRVADAMHGEHMAELENLGPMLAGAFGDLKWSGKGSSKELGSKDIDGVKAEGKLRSYEIPAGEMGNKNAIVVTDESWYAPELQMTVYSKHSDPRSGDRIYRLAKLNRAEPAAALFAIPSDYTVKEGMANIKKTIIEKK